MSPSSCLGDELVGPAWDRVRALRWPLFETNCEPLDCDAVPAALRDVLVLASLFSTGEEGLWHDFEEALDTPSRNHLVQTVEANRAQVDAGLSSEGRKLTPEAYALMDFMNMYDYWCQHLIK